jgi:uncharacterized protein YjiS (DUF1127 family)
MLVRDKMEMLLIFGLMASYKAHRRQESVVAEPEEFQPFDFRALGNSADNRPCRSSNWREGYVPQNARLSRNAVKTQKQPSPFAGVDLKAGKTLYQIAQASLAAAADLHPKDGGPTPPSLVKILHQLGATCRSYRERYRQRRQLMYLDDRELKDIGITPEQAEQEARKPIWQD